MECASIDIGTNTVRLLVCYLDKDKKKLTPLAVKRIITRLGGSYSDKDGIDKESAERTFEALEVFSQMINDFGVDEVHATATSVVRRASNSKWFVDEAFKRSGIKIDVIDGDKEATLSAKGVASVLDKTITLRPFIFDIGGGSTEFIVTDKDNDKMTVKGKWSMELGVVHLTEKYLKGDSEGRLSEDELSEMKKEIDRVVSSVKDIMSKDGLNADDYSGESRATLVGTAGTVTTLAAIDQEMAVYNPNKINNYVLRKDTVKVLYKHLASLTLKEREEMLALEKGREDLIVAGAAIVLSIMNNFGFNSMRVSDAGLLEGILIDLID